MHMRVHMRVHMHMHTQDIHSRLLPTKSVAEIGARIKEKSKRKAPADNPIKRARLSATAAAQE